MTHTLCIRCDYDGRPLLQLDSNKVRALTGSHEVKRLCFFFLLTELTLTCFSPGNTHLNFLNDCSRLRIHVKTTHIKVLGLK